MTHGDAFLQSIRERPQDDAPRLIFADWLEDHGDPARAEFIRLQCRMASLAGPEEDDFPQTHPDFPPLLARSRELWEQHGRRWDGAVAKYTSDASTGRGFVNCITVTARRFVAHAAGIFRLAPLVEQVFLTKLGRNMPTLAACPYLERVTYLNCEQTRLQPRDARLLAASLHLGNLRELVLTDSRIGVGGAEALAQARSLGRLENLRLEFNNVGDEGFAALVRSERLPALTELDLLDNGLTSRALRALDGVTHRQRLAHLNLMGNQIAADGVAALVAAGALPGLRELVLNDNPLADEGVTHLSRCDRWPRLERLYLIKVWMGEAGAEELFREPLLAPVRGLTMKDNPVGGAVLAAVARSPRLTRLEE